MSVEAVRLDAVLDALFDRGIDYRSDQANVGATRAACPVCAAAGRVNGRPSLLFHDTAAGVRARCDHGCDPGEVQRILGLVAPFVVADEVSSGNGRRVTYSKMSEVQPTAPRWLWNGRLPLGAVSVLVGREGLGKSTLTAALAALVTRGDLTGDLYGQPADVVLIGYEDHIASTVVPRLMAAGADLERVHTVAVEEDGHEGLVSLPADLEAIRVGMRDRRVRLLVVDPIVAALPAGEINSHRDQEVRRALAPLSRVAEDLDLAALAVMHFNKAQGSDVAMRVGGSIAFPAAARSLLAFGQDPDDADGDDATTRVLAHAKCNLAPLAPTLSCRVEGREIDDGAGGTIPTSRLVFLGEVDMRASSLLTLGEETSAIDEAVAFLEQELEDGPQPATEMIARGRLNGLADKTLKRARKRLGVQSNKTGGPGTPWEWALPPKGANPHIAEVVALFDDPAPHAGSDASGGVRGPRHRDGPLCTVCATRGGGGPLPPHTTAEHADVLADAFIDEFDAEELPAG